MAAAADAAPRYVVYGGKTGWIGQKVVSLLAAAGVDVRAGDARLERTQDVAAELDALRPTHVLNCAGLTGRPNVDWCEEHKAETVRVNVVGTLALLDACESRGVHVTNFATGCIYHYDAAHPEGGPPIEESYPPNYEGSFYSLTKVMVDRLSWNYKHALTLRLRMPISDDLSPRNFVSKITAYERVVNVQNSVTVLHDMLPAALDLAKRKVTGVFNFTNPGTISHNEVLELYKAIIDPGFYYANFTEADQAKILKAGRCNNFLCTKKLLAALGPGASLPTAKDAVEASFRRMRAAMEAAGTFPPPPRKAPRVPGAA